jgi:hypothetical protein
MAHMPGIAAGTVTGLLTGLGVWQQFKAENEKQKQPAKPRHNRRGDPV